MGWGAQFKKNWPGHLLARGNITISISMTVLDSVVTVNELVVTVPDLVMKLVVVDTVIDLFVTVLDSLVKE